MQNNIYHQSHSSCSEGSTLIIPWVWVIESGKARNLSLTLFDIGIEQRRALQKNKILSLPNYWQYTSLHNLDRNRVSLFLTGIEEREQKIVVFPREQSVKKAGTKPFYETSLNFNDLIVCLLQNEKTWESLEPSPIYLEQSGLKMRQ